MSSISGIGVFLLVFFFCYYASFLFYIFSFSYIPPGVTPPGARSGRV